MRTAAPDQTRADAAIAAAGEGSLRIATYNVLADAYLDPAWFTYVDPAALDPPLRRERLTTRIAGLDADLVCLQEVEPDCFAQLRDALAARGYTGVFARKGRGRADGCACFLRDEGVRLLASDAFHYRDAAAGSEDSGHLALVCHVECALGRIHVANTHLRWAPDDAEPAMHVGWRQVRDLLDRRIGPRPERWVVCGDLNGTVESAPIRELLARGWLDACTSHPQPTCNPHRRAKRIDYLMHTPDLRATPQPLPAIDDRTPLPSIDEPSDHLPVVATLRV